MTTWTFVAPGLSRPAGGLIALFEVVNALARGGGDVVQVAHVPTRHGRMRSLADLRWFSFDSAVEHRFLDDLDPAALPAGDALVYTTMLVAAALEDLGPMGRALVVALERDHGQPCVPVLYLQGQGVFGAEAEQLAVRLPGLKVAVGSWLVDVLVGAGVAPADVVHIPNGLDPATFHIGQPIATRAPGVAMNFDPHPVKGGDAGIDALAQVASGLSVPGIVFGTRPPERALPAGLRFVASPTQAVIAETIYDEVSVFLQPSRQEGFGMCAVEAMACGCALVTTANGGSADYAIHEETALVCGPDPAEMAASVRRLLQDDALRVRLAEAGSQLVEQFRWSTTAARLRQAVLTREAVGVDSTSIRRRRGEIEGGTR